VFILIYIFNTNVSNRKRTYEKLMMNYLVETTCHTLKNYDLPLLIRIFYKKKITFNFLISVLRVLVNVCIKIFHSDYVLVLKHTFHKIFKK